MFYIFLKNIARLTLHIPLDSFVEHIHQKPSIEAPLSHQSNSCFLIQETNPHRRLPINVLCKQQSRFTEGFSRNIKSLALLGVDFTVSFPQLVIRELNELLFWLNVRIFGNFYSFLLVLAFVALFSGNNCSPSTKHFVSSDILRGISVIKSDVLICVPVVSSFIQTIVRYCELCSVCQRNCGHCLEFVLKFSNSAQLHWRTTVCSVIYFSSFNAYSYLIQTVSVFLSIPCITLASTSL